MAKPKLSEIDLDHALSSPMSMFRGPEDVVEHPALTRGQKIEILRRWVYDANQLEVAENEGMRGDNADEVDAVLAAIDRVRSERGDRCAAREDCVAGHGHAHPLRRQSDLAQLTDTEARVE